MVYQHTAVPQALEWMGEGVPTSLGGERDQFLGRGLVGTTVLEADQTYDVPFLLV